MAISMTRLMPNRLRKNGISRMQSVSEICESEIRIVECSTPKVPRYLAPWMPVSPKLLMYPSAKALVICNDMPSSMEKMKKMAILRCLKRAKARSPSRSTIDLPPPDRLIGQFGSVNE